MILVFETGEGNGMRKVVSSYTTTTSPARLWSHVCDPQNFVFGYLFIIFYINIFKYFVFKTLIRFLILNYPPNLNRFYFKFVENFDLKFNLPNCMGVHNIPINQPFTKAIDWFSFYENRFYIFLKQVQFELRVFLKIGFTQFFY